MRLGLVGQHDAVSRFANQRSQARSKAMSQQTSKCKVVGEVEWLVAVKFEWKRGIWHQIIIYKVERGKSPSGNRGCLSW